MEHRKPANCAEAWLSSTNESVEPWLQLLGPNVIGSRLGSDDLRTRHRGVSPHFLVVRTIGLEKALAYIQIKDGLVIDELVRGQQRCHVIG